MSLSWFHATMGRIKLHSIPYKKHVLIQIEHNLKHVLYRSYQRRCGCAALFVIFLFFQLVGMGWSEGQILSRGMYVDISMFKTNANTDPYWPMVVMTKSEYSWIVALHGILRRSHLLYSNWKSDRQHGDFIQQHHGGRWWHDGEQRWSFRGA
jgi:hypothetical protein